MDDLEQIIDSGFVNAVKNIFRNKRSFENMGIFSTILAGKYSVMWRV